MKKQGFTLIELLIVITIIGILGAIILVMMGSAIKKKAHDAMEISHIEQVTKGQKLYHELEGHFDPGEEASAGDPHRDPPYNGCSSTPLYRNMDICGDCSRSGASNFMRGLRRKGMLSSEDDIKKMFGTVPEDDDLRACYFFTDDGQHYKIITLLHDSNLMANDGGCEDDDNNPITPCITVFSDNFYEQGNAMDMPFNHSVSLYQ